MKILFVTHYPGLLGANRSLLDLIQGLVPYGVDPIVMCPSEGRITEVLHNLDIPYLVHPYAYWGGETTSKSIKNLCRLIVSAIGLFIKKKKLAQLNVEVIYSNSSVTWVGSYLSWILNKKHVWHIREFGKADYGLRFFLPKRIRSRVIDKSSAIIAISKAIQNAVLRDVSKKKVFQIYNGVIGKNQIAIDPKKLKNYELRFCMLSGLFPDKGHREAIKAFHIFHSSYPNSSLKIAGDGNNHDYIESLEKLVYELNLQNSVYFLGYIDDPITIYKESDVLIVCSRNEGMGRVTIEAMGQGVPVIGYRGGGTPELIQHEYNGLMYNGNENSLAEAMSFWVNNPQNYERCSSNALVTVEKKFTKEQYANKIYQVLNNL